MNEPLITTHQALPDVADVSPEKGVLALSRSFAIMSINSAARALLKWAPAPGDTLHLEALFTPKDIAPLHAAFAAVLQHGRSFSGMRAGLQQANSATRPCLLELQPLLGNERGALGVIVILNCGRSPEDLSGSGPESLVGTQTGHDTQSLYEHLPKGSFTIDAQWRIHSFNQAAELITGFSREEALGRHCWEIFRSDSCHKRCPMRQALDRKEPEMDRQVCAVTRNGLRRTLSVNVSLLKDRQGKTVGAIETFHATGGDRPTPLGEPGCFHAIVGNSAPMRTLFALLPDLAASSANVLICGESGTGKELIARTLHQISAHAAAPFVAVNCAALTQTLIEAELFGCEKGAYTGAEQTRPGRFEMAGRGTLLLDEIGELKPELQVKLLGVIEQRRFERVGGTRSVPFEARLISATHQDLSKAIVQKRFREDLYYRLRTVTVTVPPLRQRMADLPLLVDHFIKKYSARTGKQVRSLDPKVLRRFMEYEWPGNVRELERCIEHAFVFVKGPVIFQHHLPEPEVFETLHSVPGALPPQLGNSDDREVLAWALAKTGGRREAASRLLGISRTSMWRRMKSLGMA